MPLIRWQYCFWKSFVTCWGRSHNLNQYWLILKWSPRNELKWNTNRNTFVFINGNAFENIVFVMTAILSRGRRVKQRLNNCSMGSPNHFLLWPPCTNWQQKYQKYVLFLYENRIRRVPQPVSLWLHWRHKSVMASRIAGTSIVFPTLFSDKDG